MKLYGNDCTEISTARAKEIISKNTLISEPAGSETPHETIWWKVATFGDIELWEENAMGSLLYINTKSEVSHYSIF